MVYEYHKNNLSAQGQAVYQKMLAEFSRQSECVQLDNPPQEQLNDIYQAVFFDQPQLFWTSHAPSATGTSGAFGVRLRFVSRSVYSALEIRKAQAEIENVKKTLTPLISACQSVEDKERAVCDHLISTVEYQIDDQYNQNACSALVYKKAQCTGFAKAVKLLMDWLGVPCIVVSGEVVKPVSRVREPHAWNMVRVGNCWYHLDVTSMSGANPTKKPPFNYAYFNKTDAEMQGMHLWDKSKYPACGAPTSTPVKKAPSVPVKKAPSAPANGGKKPFMPAPNSTTTSNAPVRPNPFGAPTTTRTPFPFFGRKNNNAQGGKGITQVPAYNPANRSVPAGSRQPSAQQSTKPAKFLGPVARSWDEFAKEVVTAYNKREKTLVCGLDMSGVDAQTLLNKALQRASDEARKMGLGVQLQASLEGGEKLTLNVTYLSTNNAQRTPAYPQSAQNGAQKNRNLPCLSTMAHFRSSVARAVGALSTELNFYVASPLKDTPDLLNALLSATGQEAQKTGRGVCMEVERQGDEIRLRLQWK